MKKIIPCILLLLLVNMGQDTSKASEQYNFYLPLIQISERNCSDKSGAAFGWGLSPKSFSDLCLTNYYEYNIIPTESNQGRKLMMYWCDEWVSRDGEVFDFSEKMSEYWTSDYNDYLLLYNEWTYPDQCDMSEQELYNETKWLVENYPHIKFIVGNTYGHDHLYDYDIFKRQMDILLAAGLTWDKVYGVAIHDYTQDYIGAIEKIRHVMSEYGESKPIFITEFMAIGNLEDRLTYYENQNDVQMWFYFAPCNPFEEYSLVYRTVIPNTLECSSELTELGTRFSLITRGEFYGR